jgi:hypothetical protein
MGQWRMVGLDGWLNLILRSVLRAGLYVRQFAITLERKLMTLQTSLAPQELLGV